MQRLGGLAIAAGKVAAKQRSAFGRGSRDVFVAARQRMDLALRRILLQGDAADLTATGDVFSVQGLILAESNQAIRRARLVYRASVGAQRMEDVVGGDTLAEHDVAHRADTLVAMETVGLQLPIQDDHQFQMVPEVDLSLVQLVPGSPSVAEKSCRSRTRMTARPTF